MQNDYLKPMKAQEILALTAQRPGETKVGELLANNAFDDHKSITDWLAGLQSQNTKYGILLVEEDIGPRGNLGRSGAAEAPAAFLSSFCNVQANRFYDYSQVVIAGSVSLEDLQAQSKNASLEELRQLCQKVDKRVQAAVECIVHAGLKPVIIGGGNNNSLPTIRGLVSAKQLKNGINCINCDPHADYRPTEGRHSGNPFSYANQEGLLENYIVIGLHESYNSEEMMVRLEADGHKYFAFDQSHIASRNTFYEHVDQSIELLAESSANIGLELDLDSIKNMPSSALTPVGITEEEALHYIHSVASKLNPLYLHLSEGAPSCTTNDGTRIVGKFMAYCLSTFLKADQKST